MTARHLAVALAIALCCRPVCSLAAQQDFQAKLDAAMAKLATFDFGGDSSLPNAFSELIAASHGKPELRQALVGRLAKVVGTNVPAGAKDLACRQLAIIGTGAEVPAIAPLLADAKLSHMARYALERIPGPEADEALLAALPKVQGALRVGVIHSLGNRRAERAVGPLSGLLGDADPGVATAAARALGRIGPAGAEALAKGLSTSPAAVRPAVAEGALLAADALAQAGQREAAAKLFQQIASAEVPQAARVAADRGQILALGSAGIPRLVELLHSQEAEFFKLALVLTRELPGDAVASAVAAELGKLPPDKQLLLLTALADRGDRRAAPAVLAAAQQGPPEVRPAAFQALARLGDASLVPLLARAAAQGDPPVAQAAATTLATLPGKDVDAAVVALVAQGEPKLRQVAIEAVGQRRIAPAVSALLASLADADATVRAAALKALGETAGLAELPSLLDFLLKAPPAEVAAAEGAIAAVCARLAEREPAGQAIAARLDQAQGASKEALLRLLGRVGGAAALAAVCKTLADPHPPIRDAAVRILADWPDPAAEAHLLSLAQSAQDRKHKVLALRGYLRLAGLPAVSAEQKLAMATKALALADRDEERKLALGVLAAAPNPKALGLVVPMVDRPAMKEEACTAAVAIAAKVVHSHPAPAAAAMRKVLSATVNPELKKQAEAILTQAGEKK